MRFAPYCNSSTEQQSHGESIIGCLTYNSVEDQRNFALQKTGSTGMDSRRNSSDAEIYPLASPVNDFCFTSDSTLQCKTTIFSVEVWYLHVIFCISVFSLTPA
mmetsp:Transcript_11121/g.20843  ORF Transcript_11121/g.20843 Transcript_11121/m.20843 type:complete len:103 (+) Transcript_11121:471-779(+)